MVLSGKLLSWRGLSVTLSNSTGLLVDSTFFQDNHVGKSSIVDRIAHDRFKVKQETTTVCSFWTKQIVVDGNTYKFELWDTAGQERFGSLAPMFYRNAPAAIVVYDITNRNSFEKVKEWIADMKKYALPNVVIAIAGNKNDLEDKREVSEAEGRAYAKSMDSIFMETSAKTGANVPELVTSVAKLIPLENLSLPEVVKVDHVPSQAWPCCGS